MAKDFAAAPTFRPSTPDEKVRVMVVDDSAVVRGLIVRMLEEDSKITVVASVGNGQLAVSALERNELDVIVLDIEMPVMDGLTALPKLLKVDPDIQIIMASTLTLRNADISMRAMEAGAADYVPKPTSSRELSGTTDFKRDLLSKVYALGERRRKRKRRIVPGTTSASPASAPPTMRGASSASPAAAPAMKTSLLHIAGPIQMRKPSLEVPAVIAIGSSTGGPQALFSVLGAMKDALVRQPILITQHMPPTFTTILAEHVSRVSGIPAAEGKDGEIIKERQIYIAPGDFHMQVEIQGTDKIIRLNKNPPENFCRPSVDPMFRSISAAWGRRVLAVVLTGMGADGAKGGKVIVDNGGTVIAQDEASSVVWGMPGAAAAAGICSAILPLAEIPQYVIRSAMRR